MYCVTCLGIRVHEILSGKSYKHLTLAELRSSATNGCWLCAFFLQHVSSALRRPLASSEVLQIFLEQHSSQYRFARPQAPSNTDEFHRLNAEDDNFRDAMINVQSGYISTLIAVIGRPELALSIGATVEEKDVCYVTLEISTDSGAAVKEFRGKYIANSQQEKEKEKESLKTLLLDLSNKTLVIHDATR